MLSILYLNGFNEHLSHLQIVLQLLRVKNLKAAPKKVCLFGQDMEFLRPNRKKGVRTFLGVTGFYQKFIPNYSTIANPLFQITTKQAPDKPTWMQTAEEAFHPSKRHSHHHDY